MFKRGMQWERNGEGEKMRKGEWESGKTKAGAISETAPGLR